MPQREGDHIVETADEARGGVTGHGLRYVLAFSIVGCGALFLAVFLYFFA
jgi:hypothetical protein